MQNSNIQNKPNNSSLTYLAKGKRSFVFLKNIGNLKKSIGKKKVVIKKSRPNTESRIAHEANILKLLNKYKIGPKLISCKNNELTEEYIEGITIKKFLEENLNKSNEKNNKRILAIKIIKNILNQCRTLDRLKLNKEEMSNPYKHLIIKKIKQKIKYKLKTKSKIILKPIMIDFERARFTENPANVTQFFQYIFSNKIIRLNNKIKQSLKNYKSNQTEKNYKKLFNLL